MVLPSQPVTLSVEQVEQLNRQLSTLRHDINNSLSLVTAATELIRIKPEVLDRMMVALTEQPPRINKAMASFTTEFDKTFGITRP
jgi:hypothetical protein